MRELNAAQLAADEWAEDLLLDTLSKQIWLGGVRVQAAILVLEILERRPLLLVLEYRIVTWVLGSL